MVQAASTSTSLLAMNPKNQAHMNDTRLVIELCGESVLAIPMRPGPYAADAAIETALIK
jgi:hypothetical protein